MNYNPHTQIEIESDWYEIKSRKGGLSSHSQTQSTMKTIPIKVSIKSNHPDWNPVFNSLQAGVDDEVAGSFLVIYGNDSKNDSAKISLDWDEWDDLVKVVRKYRNKWEWK